MTSGFSWKDLGDIVTGRPNLGNHTSLIAYRLMQYSLRQAIIDRHGQDEASRIMVAAGRLAGEEFCRNLLDTSLEFNRFVAELQHRLRTMGIGIMRMEKSDPDKGQFVLCLDEDLDCSGLPVRDELVCEYDEGFFAGVFAVYLGRPITAQEVDCWAAGERTCRFLVKDTEVEAS